jgi:glutamate/aspartate transport system substrate-binding protein
MSVLGAATAATAQTAPVVGDTLARIKDTRSITLGVREASVPFSFLNEQKQSVGYSVELCLAAVDEIKSQLKLPELTVKYTVVSAAERIPKLLAGEIDLECGSTTNTKARQEKVDFSYTFFVAGMRVMTRKGVVIDTVRDLNGMPVGVSKGTTSEKVFTQLQNGSDTKMTLTQYPNNLDAFKALRDGKVKAFPQDDALLLGIASREKALADFALSELALSVEPYAIMMRKNDSALGKMVDGALARLYQTGKINALYSKWFTNSTLSIPMSRFTRDSFTRPNREAGVAMLLGYSL